MNLKTISENLRTQDNRITAFPLFIVQQKKRIYGLDPDFYDAAPTWDDPEKESGIAWLHDGEEVSPEEARELERRNDAGEDLSEHTRTGYIDVWEFVTACFTEAGCEAYLKLNGHNLRKPRIYVESGHRNVEWQVVRELLAQPLLAPTHTGMKVNLHGLFKGVKEGLDEAKSKNPRAAGYQEMLRQLEKHLGELATRYYAGDLTVVDEFLQLYCLTEKRPNQ